MRNRFIVFVISAFAIAGCQQGPTKQEIAGQGEEPLSGKEIRQLLTGNTLYETGKSGGTNWEFAAFVMEGGKARGRAWWASGEQQGEGSWRIDGNLWCEHWQRDDWAEGKESCQKVYKRGDNLGFIVVRGSGENDLMTLKQGNPYDL